MTREEAEKILAENHCCPIHIGERMSQSESTGTRHCWSCARDQEIELDRVIKEAADVIRGELQTA